MSVVRPARSLSLYARVAGILEILLGVGAVGGGTALMIGRHGEIVPLPVSALAGSPFPDYFLPGLVLFTVIGLGPLAVAVLAWRGSRWAPILTTAAGVALLVWLAVEIAIIGYTSEPPLQALYLLLGAVITLLGVGWVAKTGIPTARAHAAAS